MPVNEAIDGGDKELGDRVKYAREVLSLMVARKEKKAARGD